MGQNEYKDVTDEKKNTLLECTGCFFLYQEAVLDHYCHLVKSDYMLCVLLYHVFKVDALASLNMIMKQFHSLK